MKSTEFEYDGLLVFNGIFELEQLEGTISQLDEEALPQYTPGSPEKPSSGFERLDLDLENSGPSGDLLSELGLQAFRYTTETYREVQALNREGDQHLAYIREEKSGEAYFVDEEYLFIRSSTSLIDNIRNSLYMGPTGLRLRGVSYDADFLLWLIYKYSRDERISENLDILAVSDVELTGSSKTKFGKKQEIKDTAKIAESLPFIQAILKGKAVNALSGTFQVDTRYIRAKISDEGRAHVRASEDIASASDRNRILMSILFLYRLGEAYKDWRARDPQDKYPDPGWLKELHENAQRAGVDINFAIGDSVESLAEKRGEEIEEYDLNLD